MTFGDFQKEIRDDGKAEKISIIPIDYFSAFYGEKAEENSTILITQPQIIIDKLLQRLIEMGANIGTDVFVSSVKYKEIPGNVMYDIQYPFEFFRKDIAYAKQKEIRILVDINKNEILKENLSAQNFIVDIGDISKYATAYEAYENDMITSLKGSKLLFSLPKPRDYDMSEMNAPELIEEMFAAYFHSIRSNEKPEKRIELIEGFSHLIEQKCQMSFSINNDKITCYGEPVGYEEWWHEFTDRGKLEREIKDTVESFICTQKYTEAIEYCKQYLPNERLKELLNFMCLKINCGAKAFDVTEQILPVCIDEEIYAIQALETIVQAYCLNDMYEEALQKAILLEETYGYNHRIHNYKGVCYVKTGHINEAIEEFNKSIKLSNNSTADWNLNQLNRVISGDLAPEKVQAWMI